MSKDNLSPLNKAIEISISFIAVAMVAYHLISTQYILMDYDLHKFAHLGFALILVFVSLARRHKKHLLHPLLFAILSFGAMLYLFIFYGDMIIRVGAPTNTDIIVGIVIVIVVFEGTRRTFGNILPILALISIMYAFLGEYLPGTFHVPPHSLKYILIKIALDFGRGIYGSILTISVNYIFLFMVFGALLHAFSAVKFFEQIGRLAGGKLRGGAALSSIASSAVFGMVSGTASANVVLTGSFTIPTMKRSGYSPAQAGAVEAASSTVGQVTPPVMGAAAFLMAYFTEQSYVQIMKYAVLPALFTYFCMGVYAQLQATKYNLAPLKGKVDYRVMALFCPVFLLPLSALMVLLIIGYSPMFSIFWTIIALVLISLLIKETRASFSAWMKAISEGAILGSTIAVMSAIIGIVVAMIVTSGLGVKIPAAIEAISGGSLPLALLLTMFASLLLGLGMPTVAAYTLVAFMVAPFLIHLGVGIVQAHFFVFYFAVFSIVTPPVAPAAATAAVLAGASYFRTGIEASRVAIAGFLLPYLFIWCPVLMLEPEDWLRGTLDLLAIVMILTSFQIVSIRYYFVVCGWLESLLAASSIILLFAYCYSNNAGYMAGMGVFTLLTIVQYKKWLVSKQAKMIVERVSQVNFVREKVKN